MQSIKIIKRTKIIIDCNQKMFTTSFQDLIESIETLSPEDQDFLFDLIRKRRIEKRRAEISENTEEIMKDLQEGKAKIGTVNDLITDLLLEN